MPLRLLTSTAKQASRTRFVKYCRCISVFVAIRMGFSSIKTKRIIMMRRVLTTAANAARPVENEEYMNGSSDQLIQWRSSVAKKSKISGPGYGMSRQIRKSRNAPIRNFVWAPSPPS